MLYVKGVATRTLVKPHKHMASYMGKNIDSWCRVLSEVTGEDSELENLIFVRGHVKTSGWGVGAASKGSSRLAGSFAGGHGPYGAQLRLSKESFNNASFDERWGPDGRETEKSDQCIFLNYYKVRRRRFWGRSIKAGAGPHTLPDPEREGDGEHEEVAYTDSVEGEGSEEGGEAVQETEPAPVRVTCLRSA